MSWLEKNPSDRKLELMCCVREHQFRLKRKLEKAEVTSEVLSKEHLMQILNRRRRKQWMWKAKIIFPTNDDFDNNMCLPDKKSTMTGGWDFFCFFAIRQTDERRDRLENKINRRHLPLLLPSISKCHCDQTKGREGQKDRWMTKGRAKKDLEWNEGRPHKIEQVMLLQMKMDRRRSSTEKVEEEKRRKKDLLHFKM